MAAAAMYVQRGEGGERRKGKEGTVGDGAGLAQVAAVHWELT